MSGDTIVQLSGNGLAVIVVLREALIVIRDWRGGSPELRTIRSQLTQSNDHLQQLLATLTRQNQEMGARRSRR